MQQQQQHNHPRRESNADDAWNDTYDDDNNGDDVGPSRKDSSLQDEVRALTTLLRARDTGRGVSHGSGSWQHVAAPARQMNAQSQVCLPIM